VGDGPFKVNEKKGVVNKEENFHIYWHLHLCVASWVAEHGCDQRYHAVYPPALRLIRSRIEILFSR